jgi:hypothetical protein
LFVVALLLFKLEDVDPVVIQLGVVSCIRIFDRFFEVSPECVWRVIVFDGRDRRRCGGIGFVRVARRRVVAVLWREHFVYPGVVPGRVG